MNTRQYNPFYIDNQGKLKEHTAEKSIMQIYKWDKYLKTGDNNEIEKLLRKRKHTGVTVGRIAVYLELGDSRVTADEFLKIRDNKLPESPEDTANFNSYIVRISKLRDYREIKALLVDDVIGSLKLYYSILKLKLETVDGISDTFNLIYDKLKADVLKIQIINLTYIHAMIDLNVKPNIELKPYITEDTEVMDKINQEFKKLESGVEYIAPETIINNTLDKTVKVNINHITKEWYNDNNANFWYYPPIVLINEIYKNIKRDLNNE